MKKFVIGDIHGAYKALVQCLDKCKFDDEKDLLIALGDVCDGYPDVRASIDRLLEIRHCRYVLGNHDIWALNWALKNEAPEIWTKQGGAATISSYEGKMPENHVRFLKEASYYYETDDQLFVHGGLDPQRPVSEQPKDLLLWDRDLFEIAWTMSQAGRFKQFGGYKDIFIGHTPTMNYESTLPIHACNLWALDTGAGWSGVLTVMDIETKQYWQSDNTPDLYKGFRGRHL